MFFLNLEIFYFVRKEVKEADKEMVAQLSEEKPVTANTGEDEVLILLPFLLPNL